MMTSGILLALLAGSGFWLLHEGTYGLTLFMLLPVGLGAVASWTFRPKTAIRAALVGLLAAAACLLWLLVLSWEGALCIMMALPLALPLAALGSCLVFWLRASRAAGPGAAMFLLLTPATVLWDVKAPPPVFAVTSTMDIAATPAQVWKHMVTFSEMPAPSEWYFRAGVAYPKLARITGFGVGGTRYCEFSTGPVVEPIEVWDEPRRLRFSVTVNTPPLHEWTPSGEILTKHLHGYLVAKQGEFQLRPLANGHTLLVGTTWYQHGLWPAQYWRWWSDAVIHRIHARVLGNIRIQAERDAD